MELNLVILVIFIFSCLLSVLLVAFKPSINIKYRENNIKLDTFWFGVFLGAVLLLASNLLSWKDATIALSGNAGLSPAGILVLFLSMVFISAILDQTGFFEYCANLAIKYSKGNPRKLFFATFITVSILTIFTSNDDDIIIFTPFIYYLAKNAKLNPIPYLFAEFFAANTSSILLYTGNPTNIIVAGALGLDFVKYTLYMLLPTLAASVAILFGLYYIFRRELSTNISFKSEVNLKDIIKDKTGALIGITFLIGCIIILAAAEKLGIAMWKISFFSAILLFIVIASRKLILKLQKRNTAHTIKIRKALSRMPWSVIPFVLSLFIIVFALGKYGLIEKAGTFLGSLSSGSVFLTALMYGFSSAISANLINNIPMTVTFVPLISHAGAYSYTAALATTIGSNLGANITPFGALAGIMWLSILKSKGIKIKIMQFVKIGLPVTFLALAASLSLLGLQFLIL